MTNTTAVNSNLEAIIKSDVLESFTKEKILKSLKRFGIPLSETEFNELITKSCSLEEVSNGLIEKFKPKTIIVTNLARFIEKYWELVFPDYWPAELVIDSMNELSITLEPEEDIANFKLQSDVFKHIKAIYGPLQESKISDLKTQFEKSLLYWIPKIINLYEEIDKYPDGAWEMFLELSDFIKKNPKIMESLDYTKELSFIKARLLYMNQKQTEAFEFLDKSQEEKGTTTEILIEKLDLLLQAYDKKTAQQFYTEIEKLLDSKDSILEEEAVEELINYFIDFQELDEENAKKNQL